jgi:hypothetical protein
MMEVDGQGGKVATTKIPINVTTDFEGLNTINAFPTVGTSVGWDASKKIKTWVATPEYVKAHTKSMGGLGDFVEFDVVVRPKTTSEVWAFGKDYLSVKDSLEANVPPEGYVWMTGQVVPGSVFTPLDLGKIKPGFVLTQSFMNTPVLYNMAKAPGEVVTTDSDVLVRLGKWLASVGF